MTIQVGNHVIEFDEADAPLILAHKWGVVKCNGTLYARTAINGRQVKMHRLLRPELERVDHKDTNGLNNRRDNLRQCSQMQNTWNRRKLAKATSRFKGVTRVRNRKHSFEASCTANGKRVKLGRFFDEVAAALAYDIACVKLHGEFSRPNFSIVEAALVHPKSLLLAAQRCERLGLIKSEPQKLAA